ncbi:MAG: GNAT family N-acetyltransferase, partial [Thermoflexaceae bacterium]|nr:GNAT family N-acetyltransferase [Thermoflexaceae bacterium]
YSRKFHLPVIIKETSRLILREITPGDAEAVRRLYEDKESTQYIPGLCGQEMERETVTAYIKNMYGFYGYGMWVVVRKRDNCLIGRAGIENRMISGKMYHEIGYFIGKEYQKRGYGEEAAQAVIMTARELGIKELVAYMNKKNAPSIKLARKLGFHYWKKLYDGDKYVVYRKRLALA